LTPRRRPVCRAARRAVPNFSSDSNELKRRFSPDLTSGPEPK
jgi:hypothetical protein